MKIYTVSLVVLSVFVLFVRGEDVTTDSSMTSSSTVETTKSSSTKPPSSTVTVGPVTTVTPTEECIQANNSCETCVAVTKCMWCNTRESKCIPYPVGDIIPGGNTCPLDHARWGVCWVNFKVLLIVMGVVGGIILLSLFCCIYCCCCRSSGGRAKYVKEEAKQERDKDERKQRSDDRKAERQQKHDEIRKKYGLIKDDNPYQRFDA